jgi:hypothetical protein
MLRSGTRFGYRAVELRGYRLPALLAGVLVAGVLAGCGGSSHHSSNSHAARSSQGSSAAVAGFSLNTLQTCLASGPPNVDGGQAVSPASNDVQQSTDYQLAAKVIAYGGSVHSWTSNGGLNANSNGNDKADVTLYTFRTETQFHAGLGELLHGTDSDPGGESAGHVIQSGMTLADMVNDTAADGSLEAHCIQASKS